MPGSPSSVGRGAGVGVISPVTPWSKDLGSSNLPPGVLSRKRGSGVLEVRFRYRSAGQWGRSRESSGEEVAETNFLGTQVAVASTDSGPNGRDRVDVRRFWNS